MYPFTLTTRLCSNSLKIVICQPPRFLTGLDTNQPVQSQTEALTFKFQILEERLYCLYSKNKGADQL